MLLGKSLMYVYIIHISQLNTTYFIQIKRKIIIHSVYWKIQKDKSYENMTALVRHTNVSGFYVLREMNKSLICKKRNGTCLGANCQRLITIHGINMEVQ